MRRDAPDLADWLLVVGKVFGKLAAVHVDQPEGLVVRVGVLVEPRDYWDGSLRRSRW